VGYQRIPPTRPHLYALNFRGKRGAYALAPRFNKYRGSFTISFYFKPRTINNNQILIAQWAPKRWQYIFRLQKGGRLYLQLRRDKYNTGSDPRQDMLPGGVIGGKVVPNRWHYAGFSWNHQTGVAKIYLDGKIVATKKTKYPDHDLYHIPYPKFQLGYKRDSHSEFYNGLIANLRFDRGILSHRTLMVFFGFVSEYTADQNTCYEEETKSMSDL
jgi:hypothetical protein